MLRYCGLSALVSNVGHMTIDPGVAVVPVLTFAQRLRIAREHAGLEQTELAERAKIGRATISAAERGHRVPSSATLTLWAWACGVSRHWIETGEAPSPGGDGAPVVRPEGFEPPTFWLGATRRGPARTIIPLRPVPAAA